MMQKRRELERPVRDAEHIPGTLSWVEAMVRKGLPAGPVVVRLGRERRTLDQNAKLWPMLSDIAKQIQWVKDGELCHMPPEEWKDLFTASLSKQSMAPGIDGGMVVLGLHTRNLPKRQFSDLIELMYEFGSERDVTWSEQAQQAYEQYRHKEKA